MLDVKNEPVLKDGEPCNHPGCLSHVSHPCEGCGRIGGYKKAMPPKTIYLQCYDESGNLLSALGGVWCRDRINDNDAVYILATQELWSLLRRLANCTMPSEHGVAPNIRQCIKDRKAARELALRIIDNLG